MTYLKPNAKGMYVFLKNATSKNPETMVIKNMGQDKELFTLFEDTPSWKQTRFRHEALSFEQLQAFSYSIFAQEYATKKHGGVHYDAAVDALKYCKEKEEIQNDEARRGLLAEKIHESILLLATKIEKKIKSKDIGKALNGMLWMDAILFEHMNSIALNCDADVKRLLESSINSFTQDAIVRFDEKNNPFELWLPEDGREIQAVSLLSFAVWVRFKPEVVKPVKPYGFTTVIDENEDRYATIPKALGAASWSLGGAGIEQDNEKYAPAPGIIRYLPRGSIILAGGKKPTRPAQQILPVDLTEAEEQTLVAVQTMTDTQYVLAESAGKAFLFMAITSQQGGLSGGTVREITKVMNPGRRIQKRDMERVIKDFKAVEGTQIVYPDMTSARAFVLRAPIDPRKAIGSQRLEWGYSPFTVRAIKDKEIIRCLSGDFLINFTATMRLSAKEAPLLRIYLLAAQCWNDAKMSKTFNPRMLESFTIEKLACRANTLSIGAAQYLNERNPNKRDRLSRDRKRTNQYLEALSDKHSLIVIKPINKDEFKILPPENYLDVLSRWKKGEKRPDDYTK